MTSLWRRTEHTPSCAEHSPDKHSGGTTLNIKKGGHRDLERYFTLIEMDFDSEELLPKIAIHKGMMNGSLELLIAYDEDSGMDAGYALVATKNLYGYVLLKYLAVMP